MKVIILGGGLAGLTTAYFLQDNPNISQITILEKEKTPGGLCRSFRIKNIHYDIGPHIIFSKNQEVLEFMNNEILGSNLRRLRRSNVILFENKVVQYPFENDLSKIGKIWAGYCMDTFINNSFKNDIPKNMLHFFFKTFGIGITNLYLRPYNEKIWKYPIDEMDTQMVNRIPSPPAEDIIKSAEGKTIDGYLHQLHFTYPIHGGIQSITDNIISRFNSKIVVKCNQHIKWINKKSITTKQNKYKADKIISTIPMRELVRYYSALPFHIKMLWSNELKHNSIYITVVNVKNNNSGNHFAFMIPDSDVIFHRISKLDFLGQHIPDSTTTYMVEVTVPAGAKILGLHGKIIKGLLKIGFIKAKSEINFIKTRYFSHAYVIYNLPHKDITSRIKAYFKAEGIELTGRFGKHEYQNMDTVIDEAKKLADHLCD